MRKFAMVLLAVSVLAMVVNCAKKEEVIQTAAPAVETVEQVPVVVDSTVVAVVDSTETEVETPSTEIK